MHVYFNKLIGIYPLCPAVFPRSQSLALAQSVVLDAAVLIEVSVVLLNTLR